MREAWTIRHQGEPPGIRFIHGAMQFLPASSDKSPMGSSIGITTREPPRGELPGTSR
jgi:hypothetical protein